MTELWMPIEGFDFYEVSDQGRVRTLRRKEPQILKPYPSTCYWRVDLRENGRRSQPYVHQLVCWAFNGPPPEDGQTWDVHHKRTKDNVPDNLEWVIHRDHWRKRYHRR